MSGQVPGVLRPDVFGFWRFYERSVVRLGLSRVRALRHTGGMKLGDRVFIKQGQRRWQTQERLRGRLGTIRLVWPSSVYGQMTAKVVWDGRKTSEDIPVKYLQLASERERELSQASARTPRRAPKTKN